MCVRPRGALAATDSSGVAWRGNFAPGVPDLVRRALVLRAASHKRVIGWFVRGPPADSQPEPTEPPSGSADMSVTRSGNDLPDLVGLAARDPYAIGEVVAATSQVNSVEAEPRPSERGNRREVGLEASWHRHDGRSLIALCEPRVLVLAETDAWRQRENFADRPRDATTRSSRDEPNEDDMHGEQTRPASTHRHA